MQRSLDKTRDTVKARIKLPGGRSVEVEGKTEVPAPPVAPGGEAGQARVYVTPGDRPTEVIPAVSATGAAPTVAAATAAVSTGRPVSRRRLLVMAGFTVVIFALGMLAITGIELVKGSPLNTSSSTSQRSGGTSLGTVLGGSGAAATATSKAKATESATEEPSATASARSTASSEPSAERGRSGASASPTPSRTARATPTPTPDAGLGGGAVPNAQSGGGASRPPRTGVARPFRRFHPFWVGGEWSERGVGCIQRRVRSIEEPCRDDVRGAAGPPTPRPPRAGRRPR